MRRLATFGAALAASASLLVVTPPAQAATFLCANLNVCGHAKDSTSSTHWLRVRCDNGDLRWVRIGRWSSCKDTRYFYARAGQITERWYADGWKRLPNGRYGVKDGQWIKVRVRG